jgi:hypothetical protein
LVRGTSTVLTDFQVIPRAQFVSIARIIDG